MATRSTPKHHPRTAGQNTAVGAGAPTRSAWVTLAGVMIIVAAVANVVWGLGALKAHSAAEAGAWLDQATFGPLKFWGWTSLIWAGVLGVTGALVLRRVGSAQILAVPVIAMSMAFWLLTMSVFPLFALAALLLDAFVMYAVLVRWDQPATP